MKRENQNFNDEPVKLEFKDVLAMIIAAIEIVFPLALLFCGIMGFVFFVVVKLWLK